jgi:hypothetical protein
MAIKLDVSEPNIAVVRCRGWIVFGKKHELGVVLGLLNETERIVLNRLDRTH